MSGDRSVSSSDRGTLLLAISRLIDHGNPEQVNAAVAAFEKVLRHTYYLSFVTSTRGSLDEQSITSLASYIFYRRKEILSGDSNLGDNVLDTLINPRSETVYTSDLTSFVTKLQELDMEKGDGTFLENITVRQLRRIGVPSFIINHLISTWENHPPLVSSVGTLSPEAVAGNLKNLAHIQRYNPRGAAILYQVFGITHFNWFHHKTYTRQLEEMNEQGEFGVVIIAEDDHNGAYNNRTQAFSNLFTDLDRMGIKTRIVQAPSGRILDHRLAMIHRKYGEAAFLAFRAHGNRFEIALGSGIFQTISLTTLLSNKSPIRHVVQPGIPVLIEACECAKFPGIASTLSQKTETQVTASPHQSSVAGISAHKDQEGNLVFQVDFEKGEGKTYHPGNSWWHTLLRLTKTAYRAMTGQKSSHPQQQPGPESQSED